MCVDECHGGFDEIALGEGASAVHVVPFVAIWSERSALAQKSLICTTAVIVEDCSPVSVGASQL